MVSVADRFARLPTAAKLLLILSLALLPIGIALTWLSESGIRQANDALSGRSEDQARSATRAVESLIARNALALRIAANGALVGGSGSPCEGAHQSLAIAPAVAQRFELETADGRPLCKVGDIGDTGELPVVAPGDIRIRVAPDSQAIVLRTGVNRGMATGALSAEELRSAALESAGDIKSMVLLDGERV